MSRPHLLASIAVLAALLVPLSGAAACAIDGIPSISANGQLAARNLLIPKKASFLTWSPFIFHRPFARGATIRLREDPVKLARALAAAEIHGRWQWTFGDGHTATTAGGATATHRYTRAGQYRIVISAYD